MNTERNRIGLAEAFGIMGVDLDAVDPRRHRLIGKLFFQGAGERGKGSSLLMVGGAVIVPRGFPVTQDTAEMWSGAIILDPSHRCIDTRHYFRGMGLCGALTGGFGDPSNYGKVIDFDKEGSP